MENSAVMPNLLERLAPIGKEQTSERTWRFSARMTDVYLQQMKRFDEDEEARQWHKRYSAENMPLPSDTRNITDVAAMMAFYSPTNFCKFQKLFTQQLLEWQTRQTQFNPYPLGASNITIIDIGAGVGIASLAIIDVLATWTDIMTELGYDQLGISINSIAVEPDTNKQAPRSRMFSHLSRLLDTHSIRIERLTEVISPFPEPQCIRQIKDAVPHGSFTICCMSNFLSSPSATEHQMSELPSMLAESPPTGNPDYENELVEYAQEAELVENAVQYAKSTANLLADLPSRNKLLLASELKQRSAAIRMFASLLYPSLELAVQWNRVRFYSPQGSYWHSLRSGDKSVDPDWAIGFWSLTHWLASKAYSASRTANSLLLEQV